MADTVVMTAQATGATIGLAGGADTLTLLTGVTNSVNVANVESILGGSLADTVVLTAQATGATIDLAGGADTLPLPAAGPKHHPPPHHHSRPATAPRHTRP